MRTTMVMIRTSNAWQCFSFCFILLTSGFGFLELTEITKGVTPAPDGGYPSGNTAEGQNALFSLTSGGYNTAVGYLSLTTDRTANFNTAIGAGTLLANMGANNTAIGAGALLSNTSGFGNTANGVSALSRNTIGIGNTADGGAALFSNTTGAQSTAIGEAALARNTTGNTNTAVGAGALEDNTTGYDNIAAGRAAGLNVTTAHNVIAIGHFNGVNVSNSCFIDNLPGITTVNNDALPVLIDSNGQLGTTSSSRRYKTDIKPLDEASKSILELKPVSFRYKVHKDTTPQFGLIAEDVAKVNPDLVVGDKNGEIYTVRYDAVNAMLLNEFLKEHKKVGQQARDIQEQKNTISELKKEMDSIVAQLKEQASKLERVSAQVELSKRATLTLADKK